MKTRSVGPFEVPAIGFGCMNLSHAYGEPPARADAARMLHRALDIGCTFLDSAALYGFGANETLLGEVLRERRDEYVLTSKCGMTGVDGKRVIDGRPETLKRTCDESLKRLQTDVIDLYYLHRWDKSAPIEDSIGAMAEMVEAGKVRTIGLSEVSAATLKKAHAVHPVAAVQSEYSLWTRNPEIAVLEACREIGAAFVAFSPLARGYLTGELRDVTAFVEKDIRRNMPRFQPDAYVRNLKLLDEFADIARESGCTMAQLALAWVLAKGDHVIPIPGTANADHLGGNFAAADIELPAGAVARLDDIFAPAAVTGPRYPAATQAEIDTEEFAD
ncbi:MAG: aldo/keto reductase [Parvularculaceae bacterium]